MIPKIVVTLALMAVQTAVTMSQKIRGPRLDSTKTTTADYGTPIPRFWGRRKFECPVIWAADLIEKAHTSKGKAGKNTQFSYSADFSVLICDHPIDAITKVWMDDKLVYQATGAGPTSLGAAAGLTVGGTMRVYLGSDTQTPDPLMEAWTDDRYGANSCPAYRGSSYVVFDHLPVNNFGNRIPNVTIEAVSAKSNIYPYETHTTTLTLTGAVFSPDRTRLLLHSNAAYEMWDVPSRTMTLAGNFPAAVTGDSPGIDNDGTIWSVTGGLIASQLSRFTSDGFGTFAADIPITGISGSNGIRIVGYTDTDGTSQTIVFVKNVAGGGVNYLAGAAVVSVPLAFDPVTYFTDGDNAWVAGNSGTTIGFYCVSGPRAGTTHTLTSPASSSSAMSACNPGAGKFVCNQANSWYTIDDTSWAASTPVTIATSSPAGELERVSPGETSVFVAWQEISFTGPASLRTLNQSLWAATSVNRPTYDRINHAIIADNAGSPLMWRFLDRIGSAGVTLQTVVDSVAGWCGLTGQDTSALTQTILGYSVSQGTGKDMIGPLLDIHDVDCRPHDFIVGFVNRGSAPSGLILTPDFVRGTAERYTVTIKQDTDLPRKLTFNFADFDHEQQPNNAIAQRPFDAVDTTREETVDLSTYADTEAGAQQKADRYLRRSWISRTSIKNALTAQHLVLEPGDVTALSLDGVQQNVRLTKLTSSATGLDCEWVRDEASVAVLSAATAGAPGDNLSVQTIYIPSPTKGFIIDAPLVRDADNDVNPVLYSAAGSYGGTWPGATVNRGDDGTYDTLFGSIDSAHNATWGYATTALATANPNLWDRGNSFSATIFGTLTSHTEAEIDADTSLNLIALGVDGRWEYLQFATATLTGTSGGANTYTLSDLKRGRRGTEINVGNHAAGDQLLVLAHAVATEVGASEVGAGMSFKIQTIGRDVDAAPPIDLVYDGDTLKPYAPAYLTWAYDGTNLTATITRRTRVGGAWVGGSTIPLGEASEAYEVDVYNGVTFKRTIALSGTNVFTYTAAMAAADGITLPTPPSVNVFQMSDAVGRGFALAA